jgi:hypothetical protein
MNSSFTAAELLLEHATHQRVYQTSCEYREHVDPYLADYATRHPEMAQQSSWFSVIEEVPTGDGGIRQTFSLKDIVIRGKSDFTLLEQQLDIELPDFFRDFYNQIQAAVLALLNPIVIYDVVEMLEVAALHQQIDIENGHPATPTHILRFAAMPPFPAWFAIRRRPFDGVWKVVSVTSDNTHEGLWTERFWPESCQETMDQWMRRLLETDGSPLTVGRSYPPPLWRADMRRVS